MEAVVKGREEIRILKDLNRNEKDFIGESENMIEYFVNNQEKTELLSK